PPQPFGISLMVGEIDGGVERAAAADAEPTGRQDDDYGRFAWLIDPAGIKVELWEPPGSPPV
ncbi:MAG: VOC family protein, partial [Caulobacteraceae bacterium]